MAARKIVFLVPTHLEHLFKEIGAEIQLPLEVRLEVLSDDQQREDALEHCSLAIVAIAGDPIDISRGLNALAWVWRSGVPFGYFVYPAGWRQLDPRLRLGIRRIALLVSDHSNAGFPDGPKDSTAVLLTNPEHWIESTPANVARRIMDATSKETSQLPKKRELGWGEFHNRQSSGMVWGGK